MVRMIAAQQRMPSSGTGMAISYEFQFSKVLDLTADPPGVEIHARR